MNQLDKIILLIVFTFATYGFYRGLIAQLFGFSAVVIGYLGTLSFGDYIQSIVSIYLDETWLSNLLIKTSLFVTIVLIVRLIAKQLTNLTNHTALSGLNRMLGGAIGTLFAIVCLLTALNLYNLLLLKFDFVRIADFPTSFMVSYLEKLNRFVVSFID